MVLDSGTLNCIWTNVSSADSREHQTAAEIPPVISAGLIFLLPCPIFVKMAAKGYGDATCQSRFFKVLLPNFSSKLNLPPAFVEKHINKEEKASTRATLIGPDAQTWNLSLGNDNGKYHMYFFGKEWNDCIEAYGLHEGYILFFCYEGKMVFNFMVYDLTACEKIYPLPAYVSEINVAAGMSAKRIRTCNGHVFEIVGTGKNGSSSMTYRCKDCNCIRFEATITHYNIKRSYMRIPTTFMDLSCLSRKQIGVTLIGIMGQSWPVSLMYTEGKHVYYLAVGWLVFVHENQLMSGDRCAFEMEAGEDEVIKFQKIKS